MSQRKEKKYLLNFWENDVQTHLYDITKKELQERVNQLVFSGVTSDDINIYEIKEVHFKMEVKIG